MVVDRDRRFVVRVGRSRPLLPASVPADVARIITESMRPSDHATSVALAAGTVAAGAPAGAPGDGSAGPVGAGGLSRDHDDGEDAREGTGADAQPDGAVQ